MASKSLPVNLTDSLIELRAHYELLLAEHEAKAVHIREQLNHINALLVDQLVPSSSGALQASLESTEHLLALEASFEPTATETDAADGFVDPSSPAASIAAMSTLVSTPPPRPDSKKATAPNAAKTRGKRSPAAAQQTAAPKSTTKVGARIKLPLLAPYKGMSKIDAVQKMMASCSGQVAHIHDIMTALFGQLEGEEWQAEKLRMKDTMTRGIRRQLWQKVPGVPLSYQLLSSAPKDRATTQPQSRTKSKAAQSKPQSKPQSKTPPTANAKGKAESVNPAKSTRQTSQRRKTTRRKST